MPMTRANLRLALALAAALASALTGCADRRPVDATRWAETWNHLRAQLPGPAEIGAGEPRSRCEAALAAVRAGEVALERAPSAATADAFDRWRGFALELFFECPLRGGDYAGWDAGAARLQELAGDVERTLTAPR